MDARDTFAKTTHPEYLHQIGKDCINSASFKNSTDACIISSGGYCMLDSKKASCYSSSHDPYDTYIPGKVISLCPCKNYTLENTNSSSLLNHNDINEISKI